MRKIKTAIKLLKEDKTLFWGSIIQQFFRWLPDIPYLKLLYKFKMGRNLDLKNPRTFTEKLQWLKLYNRNPIYTTMVDKYHVKEYVTKLIGREYIIPTLAVYDCVEEIDFDRLPNQFVLKCTHDSGGIVICKDKTKIDIKAVKTRLSTALKAKFFRKNREWPYKNVRPQIIAEQYLSDGVGEINDYKFFCFNGIPRFFKIDYNRFINHQANYYNLDWSLLPFGELDCPPNPNKTFLKPENFEEMVNIAQMLSKNIPFARIDLYNIQGSIFFGEITFFPASGLGKFTSKEWDHKIGEFLEVK